MGRKRTRRRYQSSRSHSLHSSFEKLKAQLISAQKRSFPSVAVLMAHRRKQRPVVELQRPHLMTLAYLDLQFEVAVWWVQSLKIATPERATEREHGFLLTSPFVAHSCLVA
jgi:hypothetical protein